MKSPRSNGIRATSSSAWTLSSPTFAHISRLSCRRFCDREVRLRLYALAYDQTTFLRCTELPEAMADWSRISLQHKLIKIGARIVPHARAIILQITEVAVTGRMPRTILAAICRLRAPPSCA